MSMSVFIIDLGMTENGPQIYEFGAGARSNPDSYKKITGRSMEMDVIEQARKIGQGAEMGNSTCLLNDAINGKSLTALFLQPFLTDIMPKTIGLAPRTHENAFLPDRQALLQREFPDDRIVVKGDRGRRGQQVVLTSSKDFADATAKIMTDNENIQRMVAQQAVRPLPIEHEKQSYLPTIRVWCGVWADADGKLQRHYFTSFYKLPAEPVDPNADPSQTFNRKVLVSNATDTGVEMPLSADAAENLYAQLDAKFIPGLERFLHASPEEMEQKVASIPHEAGFAEDRLRNYLFPFVRERRSLIL